MGRVLLCPFIFQKHCAGGSRNGSAERQWESSCHWRGRCSQIQGHVASEPRPGMCVSGSAELLSEQLRTGPGTRSGAQELGLSFSLGSAEAQQGVIESWHL